MDIRDGDDEARVRIRTPQSPRSPRQARAKELMERRLARTPSFKLKGQRAQGDLVYKEGNGTWSMEVVDVKPTKPKRQSL